MITLQHTLITLFGLQGDEKKLEEEIPYVLLPDAIRKYSGPRQYSHFEKQLDGKDVSWLQYPLNLKNITQEEVNASPKYLSKTILPCVIGEETSIDTFKKHNKHLPSKYFSGVEKHLVQDYVFDEFIRNNIDCLSKYDDEFYFDAQKFDGKGIRQEIADIENHGVYVLAYMLDKVYGIKANQEWFDKHVKSALDKEYPAELAENTYKYMKIPDLINERITNGDWSHLEEGKLPYREYLEMYKDVVLKMYNEEMKDKLEETNPKEPKKGVDFVD